MTSHWVDGRLAVVLLILLLFASNMVTIGGLSSSSSQTYWNADGDLSASIGSPYSPHALNSSVSYAPWGSGSWAVFAFGDYPNATRGAVDEYAFNASGGIGHLWIREDRRLLEPRSGVAGFHQGLVDAEGFPRPVAVEVIGRETVLAYRIMRENTSISASLSSIDEVGIVFDLILYTGPYLVNGSLIRSTLVVDFYVHQECGPLFVGGCDIANDTSVNHHVLGHTHYFAWRIHENLREGEWVSDVVNLQWYLENSVQRTFCRDVTGSDDCSLEAPQAYLWGLTATAEAFGAQSGFALDYEYLLQANDCATGLDGGDDFFHPLRIENLNAQDMEQGMMQLDGWLGVGSLYRDSDDYYQFNVTPSFREDGIQLHVHSEGNVQTELYGPEDEPVLKSVTNGVQVKDFYYNYSPSDALGYWYIRLHRANSFGPYQLLIEWSTPSSGSTVNPSEIVAKCTAISPVTNTETPWSLLIPLTAITALTIFSGRYLNRKRSTLP